MTYFKNFSNAGKTDTYQGITQCWQTYILANKGYYIILVPTCYRDTPIFGDFDFFTNIRDQPILRNFEFYQHYVIAINRYYAILNVFAKITLYRYNVKTDIT